MYKVVAWLGLFQDPGEQLTTENPVWVWLFQSLSHGEVA